MIKDTKLWEQWEKEYRRKQKPDLVRNLEIYDALYEEARLLGVLPACDPLEGIETKIELARALNVSGPAGKNCTGALLEKNGVYA